MTDETTARDRAIEVALAAPIREGSFRETTVIDALLAQPEVLRALVGETVREWGACDLRDDPNDPQIGGGVDAADDEDDAQKIAASWSTGRLCWRDVTYGQWRTG